jgi:hypothetical protein
MMFGVLYQLSHVGNVHWNQFPWCYNQNCVLKNWQCIEPIYTKQGIFLSARMWQGFTNALINFTMGKMIQ